MGKINYGYGKLEVAELLSVPTPVLSKAAETLETIDQENLGKDDWFYLTEDWDLNVWQNDVTHGWRAGIYEWVNGNCQFRFGVNLDDRKEAE